jgi:heat shock protein HslJ
MRLTRRLTIAILIAVSMLRRVQRRRVRRRRRLVAARRASPPAGSSLTGQPWALSAVTGKTPAFQGVVPAYQQPDYTITFNTDGTYSGTAACNQIAGTYKTSGNSLTITAGPSTLAFCPQVGGDSDFGTIFAHSLTEAATYAVTNDTLTITLTDGGTMTFGPLQALPSSAQSSAVASLAPGASPPAELLGKTWKLTGITETTPAFQGVVPEADQSKYTIEFQADGTFTAKADCNQVAAPTRYTAAAASRHGAPPGPEAGRCRSCPDRRRWPPARLARWPTCT